MAPKKKKIGESKSEKSGLKSQIFSGYIVKDEKLPYNEEELFSDSDNDDFEFAGNFVKKVSLPKTKVLIQTVEPDGTLGGMCYVTGKFPFLGQYWFITLETKLVYGAKFLQSLPAYRLRTDLATRKDVFKDLIYGVLRKDEKVSQSSNEEIKKLMSFLDRQPITDYTPYYNTRKIAGLVEKCAFEQKTEGEKSAILYLLHFINQSEDLNILSTATECPSVFKALPVLVPKYFYGLIKEKSANLEFMRKLENIIVKLPWILAFSWPIKQNLGIGMPEVYYGNYEKAGLWEGMEQPYKDAIMIYYVLKDHCFSTGDTYINSIRLNGQTPRFKAYILTNYAAALEYLEKIKAVHIENGRVFLKRLYDAEKNIAAIVSDMIKRNNSFSFPLDFTSEALAVLARDEDQKKAAEMIANNPVVVMSGRGGCGKTEVIARVCKVAVDHLYKQKKKTYDEYIKTTLSKALEGKNVQTKERVDNPKPWAKGETCHFTESDFQKPADEVIPDSNKLVDADTFPENKINTSACDMFSGSESSQSSLGSQSSENDMGFTKLKTQSAGDCSEAGHWDSELDDSEMDCTDQFSDDEELELPDVTGKKYILLTAPTGKAAKVIGKRAGFPGFTLHQVMYRYIKWRENPAELTFPFKDVHILVVDECSLVAVGIISFLLDIMLKETKLEKIILLGDKLQLPSIEPGNFLIDVYDAMSCINCAVTLRTNHRSEGALIVENAVRISKQGMPTFDSNKNFHKIELKEDEHQDLERDEAVKRLVTTAAFLSDRCSQFVAFRRLDCEIINNICSKAYTNKLCVDPTNKRLQFHENFKICCTKNGTVQVTIIHDPCNVAQYKVTNEKEKSSSNQEETRPVETEGERLAQRKKMIEDKISKYLEKIKSQRATEKINLDSSTKEIADQLIEDETQQQMEDDGDPKSKGDRMVSMRLCNGEVFWINAIFHEKPSGQRFEKERWIIEDEDGLTLSVFRSSLMKECRMKPCWCRTIHTYQGSEIKHLAYLVGAAGRQNWQHVYTAVTRGKSSVTIITDIKSLRKSVSTANQKRFCVLEEKLKENLNIPYTKAASHEEDRVPRQHYGANTFNNSDADVSFLLEEDIEEDLIWGDDTSPAVDIEVTTPSSEIGPMPALSRGPTMKRQRLDFTSASALIQSSMEDRFSDDGDDTFLQASQLLDIFENRNTVASTIGNVEGHDKVYLVQCEVISPTDLTNLNSVVVVEPEPM